jgi:hypothetical protein
LKRNRLPLDPFDPSTPLSADYQLANLAWVVLLIGVVGGLYMLANADFRTWGGCAIAAGGAALIIGGAWVARLLWRQL